jgi:hypothetical protein
MDASWGIAYNPPCSMGLKMSRGAVLLLAGALAGCALTAPSSRPVYQQGRTIVQIEKDPAVGEAARQDVNTHPATIRPTQVIKVLSGVLVRTTDGLFKAAAGSYTAAGPVFQEEELAALAPSLSQGLEQADPTERVAFTFWSSAPGRRHAPISGYLAVKDPYLIFRLKEHPIVGWQDPENPPPASLFELDFRQAAYLKPGSEEERKGSYKARPTVRVDYRRYLNAALDQPAVAVKEPAGAAPPASAQAEVRSPSVPPSLAPRESAKSDAEVVKELQSQVKELTDSNQELRAKLKEMRDRQDRSQAMNEELARLRRDLAETKQRLADKVLELNRLKKKAGGANGGKK